MSEITQIQRDLAEWVTNYGWKVYYNQRNSDGYPTFHANTNAKPDLLLSKHGYNILTEVKIGRKHQDILNGFDQIIKYTGEYYTGRVQYTNPNPIRINAFTFATKYSQNGYLYADESKLNYMEHGYLSERQDMTEKPITHTVTRFLWRQWEKGLAFDHYSELRRGMSAGISPPPKPYIGVILAKTIHSTHEVPLMPYLYLNSNHFIPMGASFQLFLDRIGDHS